MVDLSQEKLNKLFERARREAVAAQDKILNQYGEGAYCGFAWVTVHPEHKGNTLLGKAERRVLESMGFKKDWTGKSYALWNPTGYGGQSMDVKEAGAIAYAKVLRFAGFNAHMGSRPD